MIYFTSLGVTLFETANYRDFILSKKNGVYTEMMNIIGFVFALPPFEQISLAQVYVALNWLCVMKTIGRGISLENVMLLLE